MDEQEIKNTPIVKTDDSQNEIAEYSQNKNATIWNDDRLMKKAFAAAKYLSSSDLVPLTYKNKPENCLIAMDMANNTGLPPLTVMQNLFVVQGRPAWSGQMCIALVNNSGRYAEPLEFVFVGVPGTLSEGCYAQTRTLSGKLIKGSTVTMQMAQDEGWLGKSGSKWKTMKEQMFQYRAGAFFARIHCPDVLCGLPTVDEIGDVYGNETSHQQKVVISLGEGEISG